MPCGRFLDDRAGGPLGVAVDTVAVVATVFGVATSLGLGAAQVNGGLAALVDGVQVGPTVQLRVIGVVTVLLLIPAMSGLNRGIKWLSIVNVTRCQHLRLRPAHRVDGSPRRSLHHHAGQLPRRAAWMSLQAGPFDDERHSWMNGWTVFSGAWWISRSPFVATFIARISRGRTIREFVVGVLAVPPW